MVLMAVEHTFVGLESAGRGRAGAGAYPCQGVYYKPEGREPDAVVIATHYDIDFSQHYLAEFLASRGVGFLGWNTRFRGLGSYFLLDQALVDIGVGVRWVRETVGAERVVLLGNSGGASLMASYQSQAVEPNVRPGWGLRPAPGVRDLSPGDAFVSLAGHPGRPDVLTKWMDAAVLDESDPVGTDSTVDLWNPENGPPYSEEFLVEYRSRQVQRNERVTAWVWSELKRLEETRVSDRLFTTYRTWADPRMVDASIEPNRRRPNSCYAGDPERANFSVWGTAASSTLRTWLSMWSLEESECRAGPHLGRVSVPSLVISAEADTGVFESDAVEIFDSISAQDKARLELEGDHYFREPEDARERLADVLVEWIGSNVA